MYQSIYVCMYQTIYVSKWKIFVAYFVPCLLQLVDHMARSLHFRYCKALGTTGFIENTIEAEKSNK